jgi:hypothetical protein
MAGCSGTFAGRCRLLSHTRWQRWVSA